MTHPATDTVDLFLLFFATPPALAFVVLYGTLLPWYRSWMGWALFTSSTSMACLFAESLLYRLFEWPLLARTGWLRTALYALTGMGAWMMLTAFVVVYTTSRRDRRSRQNRKEPFSEHRNLHREERRHTQ